VCNPRVLVIIIFFNFSLRVLKDHIALVFIFLDLSSVFLIYPVLIVHEIISQEYSPFRESARIAILSLALSF